MTKHERLSLEIAKELLGTTSGLLTQNAAILSLLAENLPNLTEQQRIELRNESKLRLKSAQNQKENENHLSSILEHEQ